ncbi:MAG: hypothetical protein AVDCRST_MAG93-6928 [uncultured Chloroflexia bacterium]|uniref:Uncharacterized protein n=1 Tax=uncultured Chloroflexia bacterium TaxID=1672391 RepID=A0A6J4M0B8_9CHLR|nr:MAG: hypothetical protein AVDCRST_MAG93-6928 [uncultured Chloroflexia bacterium]
MRWLLVNHIRGTFFHRDRAGLSHRFNLLYASHFRFSCLHAWLGLQGVFAGRVHSLLKACRY